MDFLKYMMFKVYDKKRAFSSALAWNNQRKVIQVSSNKTDWFNVKCDDDAFVYAWLEINKQSSSFVIIVDIDEKQFNENYVEICKHIKPNYIIHHPFKEHSIQIGYVLNRFVSNKNNYYSTVFNDLKNSLYHLFNSDLNNKNYKAKNPLCEFWETEWTDAEFYNIQDLEDAVLNYINTHKTDESTVNLKNINKTFKENKNYVYDADSDNCKNFDDLRFKGYEWIETFRETITDEEQLKETLFNFLYSQVNYEISNKQTDKEIKTTIKSIVKFCVYKYKSGNNSKYTRTNQLRKEQEMKVKEYIINNYDISRMFREEEKQEIATKFNLSPRTINAYLTQLRKITKVREDLKDQTFIRIIDYRNNKKLKWKDIAILMGMKEETIKQIYKRNKNSARLTLES